MCKGIAQLRVTRKGWNSYLLTNIPGPRGRAQVLACLHLTHESCTRVLPYKWSVLYWQDETMSWPSANGITTDAKYSTRFSVHLKNELRQISTDTAMDLRACETSEDKNVICCYTETLQLRQELTVYKPLHREFPSAGFVQTQWTAVTEQGYSYICIAITVVRAQQGNH